MNQNDLNTLSHVIESIGFQSGELDNMAMAIANYRETEPAIVQAMFTVFANALHAQAKHLLDLGDIVASVYHSQEVQA